MKIQRRRCSRNLLANDVYPTACECYLQFRNSRELRNVKLLWNETGDAGNDSVNGFGEKKISSFTMSRFARPDYRATLEQRHISNAEQSAIHLVDEDQPLSLVQCQSPSLETLTKPPLVRDWSKIQTLRQTLPCLNWPCSRLNSPALLCWRNWSTACLGADYYYTIGRSTIFNCDVLPETWWKFVGQR